MSKLLSLPSELVLYILLCLPASSIQICQLINKYFNVLIRDSVTLQYVVALGVAKAEDNAWLTLSKTSKLKSLRVSQDAWDSLQASFVKSVPVGYYQSEVYNLSSGYFFLGNINDSLLHFLWLPTMEGEEIKWKAIRTNKPILGIGLAAFEHDLIALVTRSPLAFVGGTMASFDIEVELRELSTNASYRLAQNSTLYVMRVEREEPAVHIEIVGQHLVIIVLFHRKEITDRVFIFDWKNNMLKASFEARYLTYENLLFLSEDLIILPNTSTGALDVFRIPLVPLLESLVPIVRLALPALTNEYILDNIYCQCAPNPVCPTSIPDIKRRTAARAASRDGGKYDDEPQRGCRAKAQDALCLFGLSISGGTLDFLQINEFEFVVHRNALVAAVERFELADTTPSTPHKPVVVQWGSWGAGITSWENALDYTSHRIAASAGQRLARMRELDWDEEVEADADEAPFIVLDYNQTRVSMMRRWLEAQPGSMKVRLGASEHFVGIGLVDADRGGDGAAGQTENVQQNAPAVEIASSGSAGGNEDDLSAEWTHVSDPTSMDAEHSDISQPCTEDWRIQPVGAVYWAPVGEVLETHRKVFAEPIVSVLPYIARVSMGRFRYTEMVMNEERVIGIHSNNESGCIEQLEIHHFG